MGNKCGCCSCCQTRPRYKQHVRAAVFNNQIESLGKFAKRTPMQLNDVGRYLMKQIVNNLQNDLRVRYAMESYSCIINTIAEDKQNKVLALMDDYVLECVDLLLLEGFKHNNVDYIMYAMQTLKSLIKSTQDRFIAFHRLSNIFDLLIKIGRSEHMETDYYGFASPSTVFNNSQLTNRSTLHNADNTQNVNGFSERTVIYHALDTLKLSVEYSKNQIVDTKFTELMSLFIYNLRPIDITKSMIFGDHKSSRNGEILLKTSRTSSLNPDGKTSTDIEHIAMEGFELLCSHIAGFNNDKLHFTLEQIELFIRRYDTEYVLTLLKTISKKSRVNAIDIAKAIADTVKYKAISTSVEVYKVEPATKMIEILIKYSSYCEKSNRYQIISSLCDCIKWLDDIPDFYQPTVPIYHCQAEREKLYAGPINTETFARLKTLARSKIQSQPPPPQEEETKHSAAATMRASASSSPTISSDRDDAKTKDKAPTSASLLPVPSSLFLTSSDSSQIVAVGTNVHDKLSVLFKFANKCLECISVYVSYHDIQSTLSRAILPRLSKARSFWHKKYLLHAAMETALQKRRVSTRRSPLNTNILRYILQCPFLNHDTVNELHKNELIDLTQLLFQNLALIPSKQYKYMNQSYLIHVLEFERMIAKHVFISDKEKPNLFGLDRQSKKWIYAVIYKCITEQLPNPLPIYILKSFATTIDIIFESATNEDVLSDDLKAMFCFLIALQKYAISLTQTPSQISYGVLIHTWILSVLFLLARCFNQSSPNTQELISRLKNIQHQRQESHQMWSHFLIDEFGFIQTSQTAKDTLTLQPSVRDESVRFPYEAIFGTPSGMLEESIDIDDEEEEVDDDEEEVKGTKHGEEEPFTRQKSHSVPQQALTAKVDIVTHVIAFDKLLPIIAACLNIEDGELESWISEASARYVVENDYTELFKSSTGFTGNTIIASGGVARSESGDYAPSMTVTIDHTKAWDQSSIPSELYFGFDVFEPPTVTGKGHSVRNLFDDDFDSDTRLKWRKNILIKKRISKMEYFNDVIDVYDAQLDHMERANEIYFNNLQHKINAEFDSERLRHEEDRNHHQHHHRHHHHHHHHDGIVGIDEDNEEMFGDAGDQWFANKYINRASFKTRTPSLLRYQYKCETDLSQNLMASETDTAAAMYVWIDHDLVTNGGGVHNEDYYLLMGDIPHQQTQTQTQATYKGKTILTGEFEYRLGLKQFDFEYGCAGAEYELEGLNLHYIDPNDMMDTAFNYTHHHSHAHSNTNYLNYSDYVHHGLHSDVDSDISEDSDDAYDMFRRSRAHQRKQKQHKRKKKKSRARSRAHQKKFNKGQMAKNFKAFSKKLRNGLEDMRRRGDGGGGGGGHGGHHQVTDSNEVQMTHMEITRQQSSPQKLGAYGVDMFSSGYDGDTYLRQQMSAKEAGSLTDGDEPIHNQLHMHSSVSIPSNKHHLSASFKYKGNITSGSGVSPAAATQNNNNLNNRLMHYNSAHTLPARHHHNHHRRHSSSTSLSNGSSVFDFGAAAGVKNANNIIEEEDPEYYQSDVE